MFQFITPQVEQNKTNKQYSNEKPKYMCLPNVLAFLSQPEKIYWSLTPQLEAVIIKFDIYGWNAKAERHLWRLDEAKRLPPTAGTYRDIRFYSNQTSYLNMKLLTIGEDQDNAIF